MDLELYKKIIEESPEGMAYHRVVFDSSGKPVDYVFLDANPAYEKMTGLLRKNIIGKKVTEAVPGIEKNEFDWIAAFNEVAIDGKTRHFEQFSEPLDSYFEVTAFCPEKNHFAVIIHDASKSVKEKKALEILSAAARENMEAPIGVIDFQKMADDIRKISGAGFAAINMYQKKEKTITVKAVAGIPKQLSIASDFFGHPVVGSQWPVSEERTEALRTGSILQFATIYEASFGNLSKVKSELLHKIFSIGDIYLLPILHQNVVVGDFLLTLPKGQELKNRSILLLYATQTGLALLRNQSERSLQNREQELTMVTENMTDVIAVNDLDGTFIFIAGAIEEILGYQKSELLGSNFSSIVFHQDHDQIMSQFHHAITTKQNITAEHRAVRRDGSLVWVEVKNNFIFDDNKDILAMVISARDISERKQLERSLQRTVQDLTERVKELQTLNQISKLLEQNHQSLESILQNIVNLIPSAWQYPEYVSARIIYDKQTYQTPSFTESEWFLSGDLLVYGKKKGKLEVFYSTGIPFLKEEGDWLYIVAERIARLIEQKQAEKDLLQAKEKAELASVAKTNFLANMSHEIRTPMNGIMGFLHFLEESSLNNDQKQYVQVMRESAVSLLSIIDAILDLTRVEAGKLGIENTSFQVDDLICSAANQLVPLAQAKRLDLLVEISPELEDTTYLGDAGKIRQILINLLGNAIKFTHQGHIAIKAEFDSDDSSDNGSGLKVTVSDTGIGMSEETLQKLFRPFSQADESTTRKFGGTGLGLSIVKAYLDLMGGQVMVSSRLGEGSDFSIFVPVQKAVRPLPAQEQTEVIKEGGSDFGQGIHAAELPLMNILLAEDDALNQKLFVKILERQGLTCHIAENGQEAYQAAVSADYDLIFMDIQMPVIDGYKATAMIREHEKENGKKPAVIIAVTAHAMKGDKEKAIEAGMDNYLPKPINVDQLSDLITFYAERMDR